MPQCLLTRRGAVAMGTETLLCQGLKWEAKGTGVLWVGRGGEGVLNTNTEGNHSVLISRFADSSLARPERTQALQP